MGVFIDRQQVISRPKSSWKMSHGTDLLVQPQETPADVPVTAHAVHVGAAQMSEQPGIVLLFGEPARSAHSALCADSG